MILTNSKSYKKFSNSKTIAISSVLSIFICLSVIMYSKRISNELTYNFLRLHIVANSDSEIDQEVKFKIRDKIIEYTKILLKDKAVGNSTEKIEYCKDLISKNKEDLIKIAKDEIINSNLNYDASIEIGNYLFPTKTYGNVKLPAGNYEAVRVNLGKAKGQNWWCVLFPPLCLIDGFDIKLSKEEIKNENLLSDETSEFINADNFSPEIKIKFKIVELLSPFFNSTKR